MNALLNAIGYQGVWLVAVEGASRGYAWPAWLAMVAFALWQVSRRSWRLDLTLMLLIVLGGGAMDSLWAGSGLLAYAAPGPLPDASPLWILAIWAAFSLTLRRSFRFLHARPWLAAATGAAGAPLAYLAAARGWQAISFPHGQLPALAAMAALWALAFPAMCRLAVHLERRGIAAATEAAHG